MADENIKEEQKSGGKKRILLVDDDREIITSMQIALEAKGYEVLLARDGNQGLAMAELILDGVSSTVDVSGYSLERFSTGQLLEGEHSYGHIWS